MAVAGCFSIMTHSQTPLSVFARFAILGLVVCSCLVPECFAQQQLLLQPSPDSKAVHWIHGPTTVDLTGIGKLNVPDGFRFLDRAEASDQFQQRGMPVSKGLVGVLAPTTASWYAVVQFADIGHIPTTANEQVDSVAPLASIQRLIDRQNIE